MTLPEHALRKRRRQILDDETGEARRFDASEHRDSYALHQDPLHQDTWVRNFVDRLAGLLRKIGGKNWP
jgi:hypothetical protein